MEFFNVYYIVFGIMGLLTWSLNYFFVFRKAEIVGIDSKIQSQLKIKRLAVFIVGFIAWALISFSLMGPRKPVGFAQNKIKVNDIFFVVDVSRSMLANDFTPNRLEVAKVKIRDFVKLRPKDRIGIVMFSERAFTLLPLSTDLNLITRIIDEIKVGFLGSGTNIGDALALAVARGAQSLAENKVIILLTDGVSNVGTMTPIQAAEEAKKNNIKTYTIGIGGAKDALIPLGGSSYQTIPGGSIDVKTLQDIARITGGKSYVARDVGALTDVLDEIERLERTEIDHSGKAVYEELYLKYLIWGVLLLILVEMSRKFLFREQI